MPQPKLGKAELEQIVSELEFMDRKFLLLEKGDGYLLQLSYYEADVTRPGSEPVLQKSRKWYVSPYSTRTEIVETAYAACLRSMRHVVREHFLFRGRRVMSPHFDIEARLEMCDEERYDTRAD